MRRLLSIALLLASSYSFAEEQRIELYDGSIIIGDLQGISNGHYKVNNPSLGPINIPTRAIKGVTSLSQDTTATPPPTATNTTPPVAAPTTKKLSPNNPRPTNPVATDSTTNNSIDNTSTSGTPTKIKAKTNVGLIKVILYIQNDLQMQSLIDDPILRSQIQAGQVQKLLNNPDFLEMMERPVFVELRKKLP